MTEDDPASAPPAKRGVTIDLGNGATAFFEGAVITDEPAAPPPIRLQSAELVWWFWPLLAAGCLAQAKVAQLAIDGFVGTHSAGHYWVAHRFWWVMLAVFALNLYLPFGFALLIGSAVAVVLYAIDLLQHHPTPFDQFGYLALLMAGSFFFTCAMPALAPRLIADVAMLSRRARDRGRR
jgi:hypothetical protein